MTFVANTIHHIYLSACEYVTSLFTSSTFLSKIKLSDLGGHPQDGSLIVDLYVKHGNFPLLAMRSIRDELRTHSRYIRDTLAPIVAVDGKSSLSQNDLSVLRATLVRVDTIPMTLDLLRYSRIHKALVQIVAAGAGWPLEIVVQADDILMRWEIILEPFQDLRADLWGLGGRLEGLKKLKNWQDLDVVRANHT